jgi:hypothetical protein
MGLSSRIQSLGGSDITKDNNTPTANHDEDAPVKPTFTPGREGDTAMALFSNPDELHEEIDPAEARRVLWKIDFMILPYLAVCYAFFYIDKVCHVLLLFFLRVSCRLTGCVDDAELCCHLRDY